MRHTRLSSTAILLASIIGVGLVSAASYIFNQNSGTPHVPGSFSTSGSGNAGLVQFDKPGSTAGIEGITLTGSFYIETIGWATFNPDARIIPPASGLITDLWTTTGTITSLYAGEIYLNSGATYKTEYDPVDKKLIGAGWNLGIGRVPFNNENTRTAGFVGRVKVLGAIGGDKTYGTLYSAGPALNAEKITRTINETRKKVSLMTRNISSLLMNDNSFYGSAPEPLDNKIFVINNDASYKVFTYNEAIDFPNTVDTIVVIGGDMIIDADITTTSRPRGIIVLKNSQGFGGNIIITKNTKFIESSIIAEGSLLSGDNRSNLYNDTSEKVALLSQDITNQLYIKGGVVSYNTVGGSIQTPAICVYGENNCTNERALIYDFNFFRGYDKNPAGRGYPDASQDDYSFIIESDPRAYRSPPPGFETR